MAGVLIGTARVQITPDMSGFITRIQADIKSALAAVRAEVPVKFTVDPLSVARAQAALGPLAAGKTVPLRFDVDPGSVAKAQAALGPLATGKTVPLRFDVNTAGAAAKIAGVTAAERLAATASADLAAKLGLSARAEDAVSSQAASAVPKLAAEAAAMRGVGLAAEAMARKLAIADAAAAAAGASAGGGDRGGGGGFLGALGGGGTGGFLGGLTTSFGRGRFGLLGGTIAGVAAWHVALDGVLEAMIAIGLATVAASAGVAAMAESARNIYTHLQAVQAVSSALGQHIAPLTGAFDRIAVAMAPQTLEVYGAGLDLVGRNAGVVAQTARQVVTLFDDWAAKIDLWAHKQGNFGSLLHSGVGYLTQFGHILGTVGQTLGNLLREDPGVAHYLLDIVGAAAKVFELFTELPAPIVSTVLALHGLYIWGRVLGAVLRTMGTGLAHMAVSLAGLAANPLVWLGAAAAAVGYFTVQASRGTPAAQKFIAAINQRIDSEQASTAITDISVAIGQLNARIAQTNTGSELRNMFSGDLGSQFGKFFTQQMPFYILGIGHAFAHLGDEVAHGGISGAFSALGGLAKAVFTNTAAGAEAAGIDISRYNKEIDSLLGSQRNLLHETGVLMTGTRGLSATQQAAALQAKRQGAEINTAAAGGRSYAQALAIMDLAGVKASDSFALMQQKVQNLIRGYANAGVQGNLLGNSVNAVTFASLQQQSKITQLTEAWTAFFTTISGGETSFTSFASDIQGNVPVHPINNLNQAIKSVHGNFTLLTAQGLLARDEFLSTAQAAQTEQNSLMTLSSAAGMGARGTHLLQQATKDMIVQMLPAARHSKALTTVLYALAQQGGYQGADAFKALSQWVGKPRQPMQQLDRITTILTVHAGSLAKDVKNLSIALGQTLTGAEKQAIFYADGGQRAFNNYAEALRHNGIQSDVTRRKALNLAEELIRVTGNTKNAHSEFDAMTIGMGYTRAQADKLWNSLVKTAKAEDGLRNKHVAITETGTGSFSISQGAPLTPAGQRARQRSLIYRAQGGLIPGFGGGDIIPLLAEPGEAVVDKERTRKYAPVLKAMGVPGMTTGGYIGDVAGLAPFTRRFDTAMTDSMTRAMEKAMKTAAARAAAQTFAGGLGRASLRQIENWWIGAGGPGGGTAHVAAAITGAEAGFNVKAVQQGQPYATTGWGLWQITPGDSEPQAGINEQLLTGPTNARAAVAKYRAAGGFSPWTTFEDGAYLRFMDQGGTLPPGLSLMANMTGGNEFVLRADQLARIAHGGGGNTYIAQFPDEWAAGAMESRIRQGFTAMEINAGRRARIGRNS